MNRARAKSLHRRRAEGSRTNPPSTEPIAAARNDNEVQSAQAVETTAELQLAEQSQVIAPDEANLLGDRGRLTFASQQLACFPGLPAKVPLQRRKQSKPNLPISGSVADIRAISTTGHARASWDRFEPERRRSPA